MRIWASALLLVLIADVSFFSYAPIAVSSCFADLAVSSPSLASQSHLFLSLVAELEEETRFEDSLDFSFTKAVFNTTDPLVLRLFFSRSEESFYRAWCLLYASKRGSRDPPFFIA
jgi:hypothetical protein